MLMNPLKKVAIFIDWENIRIGVFEESAKSHHKKTNYNQVDNIVKFINAFIDDQHEEIYRIFFYLADPFGSIINGIDYSKTPTYTYSTSLMEKLAVTEYVALRKGNLVVRGFDKNNKPIFIIDVRLGFCISG